MAAAVPSNKSTVDNLLVVTAESTP